MSDGWVPCVSDRGRERGAARWAFGSLGLGGETRRGADGLVREGVARPSGWASAQVEEGARLQKRERKRR